VATALSYARVQGANDRVRIGYIGLGNRGDQVHDAFSRARRPAHITDMTRFPDLTRSGYRARLQPSKKLGMEPKSGKRSQETAIRTRNFLDCVKSRFLSYKYRAPYKLNA
jgi:hypothetical protein